MKLYDNWKTIVAKAWSIRLMALAFLLTMAEVMLPYYSSAFPPKIFALLSGVAVAGAFVSRLVAQRNV